MFHVKQRATAAPMLFHVKREWPKPAPVRPRIPRSGGGAGHQELEAGRRRGVTPSRAPRRSVIHRCDVLTVYVFYDY